METWRQNWHDRLDVLLTRYGYTENREAFHSGVQDGYEIEFQPSADVPLGASRAGGFPDLPDAPPETPFIAQINLEDVRKLGASRRLPPSGLISVFSDEYGESSCVIFTPGNQLHKLRRWTTNRNDIDIYRQCILSFHPRLCLPPMGDGPYANTDIDSVAMPEMSTRTTEAGDHLLDQCFENYTALCAEYWHGESASMIRAPQLLFGCPYMIQEPVIDEFDMARSDEDEWALDQPGRMEWFLQLSANEFSGFTFGDLGSLYIAYFDDRPEADAAPDAGAFSPKFYTTVQFY